MSNRWTDDFLDSMRNEGDAYADECVVKLLKDGEIKHVGELFKKLNSNNETPPQKIFPSLNEFFMNTGKLPPETDMERIKRGEDVFSKFAFSGALVLLTKSLPEGYEAPNLTEILHLSGSLERHPYHRLLAVLQMLVNVNCYNGFQADGKAIITAQKLRLLHAGIRHICPKYLPDYEKQYGAFVNHEDMLGTVIAFSFLLISGWRILGYRLTKEEEEDYFYLWRIFSLMMGIHPKGEPDNFKYIPSDVADAEAFYDKYQKRHYVSADKNPKGVSLAAANLEMLKKKVPWFLAIFGMRLLPQIYMEELMGKEHCANLGIKTICCGKIIKTFVLYLPVVFSLILSPIKFFTHKLYKNHEAFSLIIFQDLINKEFGGEVTFTIPANLKEWMDME